MITLGTTRNNPFAERIAVFAGAAAATTLAVALYHFLATI
jgi:hypothetical protein